MEFTKTQLDNLFLRLRQTPEELLYDYDKQRSRHYKLRQTPGNTILGVAHCDYVQNAWSYPTYFDGQTKIRAGQVDDRVGVWLLLDVLSQIPEMPPFDWLLTTDEEIGQSTAQDVREELQYNWTFQFDRHGTDFVTYDMASKRFTRQFHKLTKIPMGVGSFSDICWLADECGSRVNIGTGYHHEHSPDAWVDLAECANQVQRFVKFASKQHGVNYPMPCRFKTKSKKTSTITIGKHPRNDIVDVPQGYQVKQSYHVNPGWGLPDDELTIEDLSEADRAELEDKYGNDDFDDLDAEWSKLVSG